MGAAEPDVSRPMPRGVLILFALVFTPVGLGLAGWCWYGAYVDARKSERPGRIVEARVVHDENPPPKSVGRWLREWRIAYEGPNGPASEWFRGGRYGDPELAKGDGSDIGRELSVWYSPVSGTASLEPADLFSKVFGAVWSTVMGIFGILCLYVWIRGYRPATPSGS